MSRYSILSVLFSLFFVTDVFAFSLDARSEENSSIIAVGSASLSDYAMHPILTVSKDDGASWTYIKNISANFFGNLDASSCKGKFCVAVGDFKTLDYRSEGPLIAVTKDNGTNWSYPINIINEAGISHESTSFFTTTSCGADNCIAAGVYRRTQQEYGQFRPLLALSQDGENWIYPKSFYAAALPEAFFNGYFHSSSCSGKTCIASGSYNETDAESENQRPLLAVSKDGGNTWIYPESIHSKATLPSDFKWGYFNTASCSEQICIATGAYSDKEKYVTNKPLLAMSKDGGTTWSYPIAIHTNLPPAFVHGDLEKGASCSGNLCVATGLFYDGDKPRPLLAMTQDGGNTWSYPSAIYSSWPSKNLGSYLDGGVSCSGNVCVAAGSYYSGSSYPLVAVTRDGGNTWKFPSDIQSILKLPLFFREGHLDGGVNCKGQVCIASGSYYDGKEKPLLLVTQDGGATWSYPKQIYSTKDMPNNLDEGALKGMAMQSSSSKMARTKLNAYKS